MSNELREAYEEWQACIDRGAHLAALLHARLMRDHAMPDSAEYVAWAGEVARLSA